MVAVATAPVPPPPVMVTVGTPVYPVPVLLTVIPTREEVEPDGPEIVPSVRLPAVLIEMLPLAAEALSVPPTVLL